MSLGIQCHAKTTQEIPRSQLIYRGKNCLNSNRLLTIIIASFHLYNHYYTLLFAIVDEDENQYQTQYQTQ